MPFEGIRENEKDEKIIIVRHGVKIDWKKNNPNKSHYLSFSRQPVIISRKSKVILRAHLMIWSWYQSLS